MPRLASAAYGVLVSRMIGRTRLYEYNPHYPFRKELQGLIEKAFRFYPDEEQEKLIINSRRPRRRGKPLWEKNREND